MKNRAAYAAARAFDFAYAFRRAAVPGEGLEETVETASFPPRRPQRRGRGEAAGRKRGSERQDRALRPRPTATNCRRSRRGPVPAGRPATRRAVRFLLPGSYGRLGRRPRRC